MKGILRTTLLLAALTGLMLLIGGMIGGRSGMLLALILSAIMNFASYWYSDRIVLAMYHAREVSSDQYPELYGMVQALSERAGLPMPRVCVVDSPMANAFATGRDPRHAALAVTTGILKLLDRNELEGVIAHELTHVKNRDTLIGAMAAALAGVITYMANIAQWGLIFGGQDDDAGNVLGALATIILAPIAAMLIQLAISRGREFSADRGGAEISGKPLALASALAKLDGASGAIRADVNPSTAHLFIVNPLKGRSMASLFSTHPSTQERIRRLTALQGNSY